MITSFYNNTRITKTQKVLLNFTPTNCKIVHEVYTVTIV